MTTYRDDSAIPHCACTACDCHTQIATAGLCDHCAHVCARPDIWKRQYALRPLKGKRRPTPKVMLPPFVVPDGFKDAIPQRAYTDEERAAAVVRDQMRQERHEAMQERLTAMATRPRTQIICAVCRHQICRCKPVAWPEGRVRVAMEVAG